MKPTSRTPFLLLGLLAAGLGVFLALPAPIDPAAYQPPAPPALVGALAPNQELQRAELIGVGEVRGPEDVDVDDQGRVYAANADGRILRFTLEADGPERLETFAQTGGRPLGLDFDRTTGALLVADAHRGLLEVSPAGEVAGLSTEAAGGPFGFTDDVDVSRDGQKVYFSDASTRFGVENYMFDLLEARPYGRLLVYDRATGATTVLRDGLYFANGVALSQNEDFVLVNETWRYRIQRCWLEPSPRAGECEVFVDNLPGFPDGVAADGAGHFFVAIFTVRNPQAEFLQPRPFLKRQLAKLPRSLWPKPAPYGLVLELDEAGRIVRSLHDPGGETVRGLSSVEPHDGALYLGNLDGDWIGRWR